MTPSNWRATQAGIPSYPQPPSSHSKAHIHNLHKAGYFPAEPASPLCVPIFSALLFSWVFCGRERKLAQRKWETENLCLVKAQQQRARARWSHRRWWSPGGNLCIAFPLWPIWSQKTVSNRYACRGRTSFCSGDDMPLELLAGNLPGPVGHTKPCLHPVLQRTELETWGGYSTSLQFPLCEASSNSLLRDMCREVLTDENAQWSWRGPSGQPEPDIFFNTNMLDTTHNFLHFWVPRNPPWPSSSLVLGLQQQYLMSSCVKNESTLSKALARYPACRQIFPARLWKQLSGTLPPSNSQYPFSQNRDQGVMSMCGDCSQWCWAWVCFHQVGTLLSRIPRKLSAKVRKGQTSCFSCILQTFSHWNLFWFHWKTSEQTRYSRRHRILRKTARMHSTSPIRQGKAIVLRCEKTSDQLLCLWIWLHPANSVWPWETVRQKDTLMHSLLQLPLSKSFHQWNHKYDHRWNKKCTYRPVLVTPSNMLEATV